jgi:hypothetical protein
LLLKLLLLLAVLMVLVRNAFIRIAVVFVVVIVNELGFHFIVSVDVKIVFFILVITAVIFVRHFLFGAEFVLLAGATRLRLLLLLGWNHLPRHSIIGALIYKLAN